MKLTQLAALLVGYGGVGSLFYFKTLKQRLRILLCMYLIGKMKGGSEHSVLYSLFGVNRTKYHVRGYVKPGYERVQRAFEKNFKMGMEKGAQVCAFVKGEKVVDLVGVTKNYKKPYNENTLQIVFSSSKSVTSLVIAMLVDRGLLKYDQKVSEVWPEFGNFGKNHITIEQVLKHEAGLPKLIKHPKPELARRENVKQNKIGEIIEQTPQKEYKKGQSNREYHAVSRGWILNEVVRRVDPQKRTIGEFVQQEINGPLGVDFTFGFPEQNLGKVCELSYTKFEDPLWIILQSLVPECMGRKIVYNLYEVLKGLIILIRMNLQAPFRLKCKKFKLGEYPSSNGISNARSLAKVAALIACGGKLGDVQLLSEETLKQFHSDATVKEDVLLRMKTKFNKGGNNQFTADQDVGVREDTYGFIGWVGFGGSIINWHPEEEISIGYAMNLADADNNNMRGLRIRKVLYECAVDLKYREQEQQQFSSNQQPQQKQPQTKTV